MNQKFIVGVDSGKYSTKALMAEGDTLHRVKFRTKAWETDVSLGKEVLASGNTFRVEYDGKTYLLGDAVSEEKSSYQLSKNSIEHILSIYVAICQCLSKSKQSIGFAAVHLACNIPINLYKSEEQKNAYAETIQNSGEPICLTVNGKAYAFRIKQIVLLPESLGPIYENTAEYRSKRATILDIGGLNASVMQVNQLIPSFDQMVSANYGMNILRGKIADHFSSKYGIAITENDAEQIMRDKFLILNGTKQEDSYELINHMFSDHIQEITNFALSRGVTNTNSELVFCGGGSLLLREHILRQFPSATICDDPQFGNVRSYLKVGEAKWLSTNSQ
ncbi:ParM/StbA family protein [Paenibacillus sp. FSL R5-0407]|uniref:ParM/StbA family protein n=1 Tax=unclassified Paenibacillus TaxID=185978 RepID=UPI000B92BE22|nr:ParM/StbA family protein [Paenibacillus sp. RUD330]ASS66979.1 ParM/StbA family protein [Paenibacillus sp. RUD330]